MCFIEKKTSENSGSEDIVIISDDSGTPIVITDSEDENKPVGELCDREVSVEKEQSDESTLEDIKDQETVLISI